MVRLRLVSPIGILLLGFTSSAFADEISRADVDQLMAECQEQRQLHIAPLREEAIQRCIDGKRGDQEYCERFNRNYGERVANRPRGMFWHLPECEKVVAAERFFRMNPSRELFDYSPGESTD
jgi:hypothetical protein